MFQDFLICNDSVTLRLSPRLSAVRMIRAILAEADKVTTFGQRKITPRACIADGKKHIRMFLAETLEELGFITAESSSSSDLGPILDFEAPDLVVLGLSSDGVEVGRNLKVLADRKYSGNVLLIGPRDLSASIGKLGRFDDPEVWDLVRQAADRIRAAGKYLASTLHPGKIPADMFAEGYDLILATKDVDFVVNGVKALLQSR